MDIDYVWTVAKYVYINYQVMVSRQNFLQYEKYSFEIIHHFLPDQVGDPLFMISCQIFKTDILPVFILTTMLYKHTKTVWFVPLT